MTLRELIETKKPLLSDEVEATLASNIDKNISFEFNESHDSEFKKEIISELKDLDIVFDNCYDTPYVFLAKEFELDS